MTQPNQKRFLSSSLRVFGVLTALTSLVSSCTADNAEPPPTDQGETNEGGEPPVPSNVGTSGSGGTTFVTLPSGGQGGETEPSGDEAGGPAVAAGEGGEGGAGQTEPATPPLYAMAVQVFNPDNSATMYLSVFDSLEIEAVDLGKAYEFPGQSDIATYGGYLYVSSGEEPTITRYSVTDHGDLVKDSTISFANLGLDVAPLRSNTFINAHKAYLLAPNGQHAIWDPTDLEITGTVDIPDMTRGTMMLDGSSAVVRGRRLYRTFYWEDWSTYTFSEEQYVATYNTDTDELISLVAEERCPNLGAVAQMDEHGTIYFSNWVYNVPGTLMKGAPESCAIRILKGTDAADPDWTLTFNELTGGHEGAQLSYVANGKALFSAVHEEEITIESDTAPYDITGSPNWETWGVDLDTRAATPISGLDWAAADKTVTTVSGRTFLLAPNEDYSESTAYEISADATGRAAFTVPGYSRAFIQLR